MYQVNMDYTCLEIVLAVNAEKWVEDAAHDNKMRLGLTHRNSIHAKKLWQQHIGISLHHVLLQQQQYCAIKIIHSKNGLNSYQTTLPNSETLILGKCTRKDSQTMQKHKVMHLFTVSLKSSLWTTDFYLNKKAAFLQSACVTQYCCYCYYKLLLLLVLLLTIKPQP